MPFYIKTGPADPVPQRKSRRDETLSFKIEKPEKLGILYSLGNREIQLFRCYLNPYFDTYYKDFSINIDNWTCVLNLQIVYR